jgi:hypothetical protein
MRQESSAQRDVRLEVDLEDPVHPFVAHLIEGLKEVSAGIADDDVDASVLVERRPRHGGDALPIRRVHDCMTDPTLGCLAGQPVGS